MLKAYSKFIDVLERILRVLLIALLAASFIIIFAQVICRYLFNTGFIWMEEVARYLIIWLSFLGSPVAIRHGNHMFVDLIEARFPQKIRLPLNILFDLLTILTCVILFVAGWQYNKANITALSVGLNCSMSIVYSSICVGSVLMILFCIELLCLKIKNKDPHPELTIGKKED